MRLIKGPPTELKYDNTNLPEGHVHPIDMWLARRLKDIKDAANTTKLQREVAKILGK